MYSEEELKTSIEKCYNYFVGLRKPFTYEIEGNGIRFKIGSKEMYKDLKELPIAQMYLICLNVMFDKSDKVNFKEKGRTYAVYPKQNLGLMQKDKFFLRKNLTSKIKEIKSSVFC